MKQKGRRRWAPLLRASTVVLAAAVAAPVAPLRAGADAHAGIGELLERRARAVLESDRDAFEDTMGGGGAAFVERQMRAFDARASVALASYELAARWDRMGDLVRPSDRRHYPGAQDVAIALVEERYRIADFDVEPAVENLFLTFVQRDGRWLIADDDDLENIGLHSTRYLWDFGPVQTRRSDRFLLLRHPCRPCKLRASAVLAHAESAVEDVVDAWPLPWRRRVVLVVPRSSRELARMLQATVEVDDFVAFAYYSVDRDSGYRNTGYRVMLNPNSLTGRRAARTRATLVHELAHIATRPLSGPLTPSLVEEAQAELVSRAGDVEALSYLDALIAAGAVELRLPTDIEFRTGTAVDIYTSYQKSLSWGRFFVQRFGIEKFVRFYKFLGSKRIVAGTARYHFDRSLRKTTGMSARAVEKAWADSIGG